MPRQLYMAGFDRDRHDIEGILHTVKLTRSAAQNVRDLIAGYGEIWSTRLFREFFVARGKRPGAVQWIDAREARGRRMGAAGPGVQWDESRANCARWSAAGFNGTLIITGFIASDRQGVQTTLGRNGSDFSGSIFGSLLDAREIHIWTDVDGVLSADPRRVPDAKVIDSLSYNEAMELAYFGAKVIHPQTMAPAVGAAFRSGSATRSRREAGHADLREAELQTAGQGHHQHREHRAGEPRRRRHDRRARHGASAVRRAARGRHLGHPDFARQLGAFDLLRDPGVEAERAARVVRRGVRPRS